MTKNFSWSMIGGRFGFVLSQYIQITYEYEETIVANEIMLLYPPLSPELGQCILRPVSRADFAKTFSFSMS